MAHHAGSIDRVTCFRCVGVVVRAVIIALAIGFIPAMIFAWIFELTSEGLKRDADVTPELR